MRSQVTIFRCQRIDPPIVSRDRYRLGNRETEACVRNKTYLLFDIRLFFLSKFANFLKLFSVVHLI